MSILPDQVLTFQSVPTLAIMTAEQIARLIRTAASSTDAVAAADRTLAMARRGRR